MGVTSVEVIALRSKDPDSVTTLCLPSMTSIIRRRVKTVGAAPVLATVAAHLLDVIARHELDASFLRDARLSINGIDVRRRGVDHFNYRADQADAAAMAT